MSGRLVKSLKRAVEPVKPASEGGMIRTRPLPPLHAEETGEVVKNPQRKASEYVELEVTSSKGKKYKVVSPASYGNHVPRVWEWNAIRYKVAQMIADGVPISHIADDPAVGISGRITIYAWLEHPEFRDHVDGITLESGFANKRERIAGMNRLTKLLFDKVVNELNVTQLNEKSIGAVLTAIGQYTKQLAQEKEEFVEASRVDQQTTVSGTLGVGVVNVTEALQSKAEAERKELEAEFNTIGDDVIRNLTGGK